MRKKNNTNGNEHNRSDICPHCGAGADGMTLGLHWDSYEQCWRCAICGFREYARSLRTDAEIATERQWDEVLEDMERDDKEEAAGPQYLMLTFDRFS